MRRFRLRLSLIVSLTLMPFVIYHLINYDNTLRYIRPDYSVKRRNGDGFASIVSIPNFVARKSEPIEHGNKLNEISSAGSTTQTFENSSPFSVKRASPIKTFNNSTSTSPLTFNGRILQIDLTETTNETFDCVNLKSLVAGKDLNIPYCIYDSKVDIWVSGALRKGQFWERGGIQIVMGWLSTDPATVLLDVGANIGLYSIPAALLGHRVVAVEPVRANYVRLRRALQLGKCAENVTLLNNALSDKYEEVFIWTNTQNQGSATLADKHDCRNDSTHLCTREPTTTIYMDDLLPYFVVAEKVIIKMDIECSEIKAMNRSRKLLQHVNVSYLMMEWMCYNTGRPINNDDASISDFIAYMAEMRYLPHDMNVVILSADNWRRWPNDVIWKRM